MKRSLFVAFSILMLCSLLLLITVGTTMATEEGYIIIEYDTLVEPTFDGEWTTDNEWTDGDQIQISENVFCTETVSIPGPGPVFMNYIIEIFDDNTNDTGDYWQICVDGNTDGGSAPGSYDYRIEVVGHTDLICYEGDGTGWTEITPVDEVVWADSISESPLSSTPHWILEISIEKTMGAMIMQMDPGLRVAVYDESNSAAGVRAWPPTDRDVPEGWGLMQYAFGPIPESLTFAVMVFLSSVWLLASLQYLWKRKKKREKQ